MAERSDDRTQLLADVAITDAEHDRLDRTPFAYSLARSILALEGKDSFVFGLCGPWGSGKTSVLNLLLQKLVEVDEAQRPIIIHFNPWWFSGRHQLLESFLGQFSAAIELPDKGSGAEKASTLFRRLSIGLRPISFIPGLTEIGKAAADAAKSASDAAQMIADATRQNVYQLRQAIDEALRELNRKIIVVMDDIDRLAADEIAEVFLILKAVADFPNTLYVLAFDHTVVRRAIQKKLGVNGRVYLEKIVQLQLELPTVGHTAIHQLFLEQIGQLLDEEDVTEDSKQDFGNIFHDGVKQFLTTPRASKKLLNTLRFTYPPLKGEVYFPDMVGVATLFTFAPSAVNAIANNSEAFTGTERYGEDRKKLEEFHNQWLSALTKETRPHVEAIAKRLFPKMEWAFNGPSYHTDFVATWRRNLLVRSADHFDKYFMLAVPAGTITEDEWKQIVAEMADKDRLIERIRSTMREAGRHGNVSRCKEFLNRADDFSGTSKDVARLESLFRSLMITGDEVIMAKDEEVLGGLMPWDNERRLLRVLVRSLEHIGDEKDRLKLLDDVLDGPVGLLTACELLDFFGREHGMFGSEKLDDPRREPVLPKDDVEKLLRKMTRKIEAKSEGDLEGELAKHPQVLRVVFNWMTFGSKSAAGRWIHRRAKDDDFMIRMLDQASSKIRSHGMSDRVVKETLSVNTRFLDRFLNLKQLKRRCASLLAESAESLSAKQKLLLSITEASISDDGEPLDERGRRQSERTSDDANGEI